MTVTQLPQAQPLPESGEGTQTNPSTPPCRLIRIALVEEQTGLKRSTIYAGVRAKTFPAPVFLTRRATAWYETEVLAWCAERTRKVGGGNV